MSFQLAAHVIPTKARAGAWNLCAAVQKVVTLYDGFRKYRFRSTALPNAGMTYFLKPASLSNVRKNMLAKWTFQHNPGDGQVNKEFDLPP